MQIAIHDSTGADVLVHGSARATETYASGPIGELRFSDQHLMEVVAKLRAKRASVYPRGNVSCTVTFAAVRQFPTAFAVLVWKARHMLDVRRGNELRLTDSASVLALTGGALGPIQYAPSGVELQIFYSFTFAGIRL